MQSNVPSLNTKNPSELIVKTQVPAKYFPVIVGRLLISDFSIATEIGGELMGYVWGADQLFDPENTKIRVTKNIKSLPATLGLTEKLTPTQLLEKILLLADLYGPPIQNAIIDLIVYQQILNDYKDGEYPTCIVVDCDRKDTEFADFKFYWVPTVYYTVPPMFALLVQSRVMLGYLNITLKNIRDIAEYINTRDVTKKYMVTVTEDDFKWAVSPDISQTDDLVAIGKTSDKVVSMRHFEMDTMTNVSEPKIVHVTEHDIQTVWSLVEFFSTDRTLS